MKISDLTLPQLDVWVAKAEGHGNVGIKDGKCRSFNPIDEYYGERPYSTDWSYGGPIIEHASIALMRATDKLWAAEKWTGEPETREDMFVMAYGDTPLIAAMRCYVESVFGELVSEE